MEQSTNRKMSMRLLPLIFISYLIAMTDRANVNFASVQMNGDLGFGPAVYGLGVGVFYAAYALFEVPSNVLLVRFGARRWLARIMVTWGLISMAQMFVLTPGQFYALRFALGAAEAGFIPGVLYYLAIWFPAGMRGRAISRFYIAWPVGTLVMAACAGALLGLNGWLGLAGWQWLFLVEGLPALAMAALLLAVLPDRPDTVAWLTGEEKAWLASAHDADSFEAGQGDHNLVRALFNPYVLGFGTIVALVFFCQNAVAFSGPKLLMAATGWTVTWVGYLVAVCGAFTALTLLTVGWHSDYRRERYWHLLAAVAGSLAGAVLMAMSTSPLVTVIGYVGLIAGGTLVGMIGSIGVSEAVPIAARPVSLAAFNTISQIGNSLGPILWGVAAERTGSFQFGLNVAPIVMLPAVAVLLMTRRRALSARAVVRAIA